MKLLERQDIYEGANCAGVDPERFFMPDGCLTAQDRINLRETARICIGCPVRAACEANASREDKFHTIRGGKLPRAMRETGRGRPKKVVVGANMRLGVFCVNGHDVEKVGVLKSGRCKQCKNDSETRRRRRLGAPVAPTNHLPVSPEQAATGECWDGHKIDEDMLTPRRICRECQRVTDRKQKVQRNREKRLAATMGG